METRDGRDIHGRLGSLADATRTRLLLLLDRHELSVTELCGAVRLPQSTVSRHLKVLRTRAGW
jgi:DNA-binding transcriptional ArsR family regulator